MHTLLQNCPAFRSNIFGSLYPFCLCNTLPEGRTKEFQLLIPTFQLLKQLWTFTCHGRYEFKTVWCRSSSLKPLDVEVLFNV
jgi:hypothetical protein